ncbi:hypothetical protein [Kineosporia sp. NBRC 101731]|uniref:hypothetical protein n=1 Tax=Kineosporia sp. NBRC 101731 TaxID=3032199 RepID=UPI0024A4C827|nr:hypothetical protein [Kineosporia sp. NBRC 101731]GLY30280.1 hypothetical protein Kisp02_36450 [Kineosporia sp. NBRC 101731]
MTGSIHDLIIGAGPAPSSRPTHADERVETAAVVHVAGASPIEPTWRTHSWGRLRVDVTTGEAVVTFLVLRESAGANLESELEDAVRGHRGRPASRARSP